MKNIIAVKLVLCIEKKLINHINPFGTSDRYTDWRGEKGTTKEIFF